MENYGGFRTFYAIKYWDKARKTNGKGQDSPYFTWVEKNASEYLCEYIYGCNIMAGCKLKRVVGMVVLLK